MLRVTLAALTLLIGSSFAHGADPAVPHGRLPDTIKPTAYRLDLTVDPAKADFSGHTEIDAVLARPTRTFFLHGKELKVSSAQVTAAGATQTRATRRSMTRASRASMCPAICRPARSRSASTTPPLFAPAPKGCIRAEVGGDWYAWTQLEPIDGAPHVPGFDEPGFKTPFTITVTAPNSACASFANTPRNRADALRRDDGASLRDDPAAAHLSHRDRRRSVRRRRNHRARERRAQAAAEHAHHRDEGADAAHAVRGARVAEARDAARRLFRRSRIPTRSWTCSRRRSWAARWRTRG